MHTVQLAFWIQLLRLNRDASYEWEVKSSVGAIVTRLHAACPRNRVSIFGSVLRLFSVQIVQTASGLHLASYPVADAAGACILESVSFDVRAVLDKILLIANFLRIEYSGNIEGTSVKPGGYIAYVAVLLCHIIGRS